MKNLGSQKETNFLRRFFIEFAQYKDYIFYYSEALERFRVAHTSLGFIWWFLDPLLQMGIYIILVRLVFNQREPNFPVFFFSAMLVWRYFSTSVLQGAHDIRKAIPICRDVYVPKFVYPMVTAFGGIYPLTISMGILFVMMLVFQVPFTIYLLWLPFLIFIMLLFTVTCTMISAHFGAFFRDFSNILSHLITLGMFATPIFYNIERVPEKYQPFLKLNPVGTLTNSFRSVITYGNPPPAKQLMYIVLITVLFFFFSIWLLYKYDKVYNRIN